MSQVENTILNPSSILSDDAIHYPRCKPVFCFGFRLTCLTARGTDIAWVFRFRMDANTSTSGSSVAARKRRESATRVQVASICGSFQGDGPMARENPGVKWNETKMRQCTKMCSTELRRGEERGRVTMMSTKLPKPSARAAAATIWQGFCVRSLELSSSTHSIPALDDNETWTQVSGH